jgi:hypothetical protein
MKEGIQDTRPDWCKEADKHSAFFVQLDPDERITFSWGHKDADVMNRAEFSGPCVAALIID